MDHKDTYLPKTKTFDSSLIKQDRTKNIAASNKTTVSSPKNGKSPCRSSRNVEKNMKSVF